MFYDWQLYVIIGLAVLAGLMLGLLIGGTPKRKEKKKHYACCQGEEWAAKEPPMILHCVKDDQGNVIRNLKRGDKVISCGYEWTIM